MPSFRSHWKRYLYAAALVAAAAALRVSLNPTLGTRGLFLTFFLSVVAAAYCFGAGPGLAATVLGGLAVWLLFFPGRPSSDDGLALAFYLAASVTAVLALRAERRSREALAIEVEQRRRAEEAETRQRRWFEATLSSMKEAVLAVGVSQRIEFLNRAAAGLTGWTLAETLGRPIDEVLRMPTEVAHALTSGADAGTDATRETALIRKDGTVLPVECAAAPILGPDGASAGSVIVLRDLTERAAAERERSRALAETRGILESIGDAFVAMDADFRFIYVNAEAERVLGKPRRELLGKTQWDLYPATGGTALEEAYRRCVTGNRPIELENYYEPWDRWFEVRAYPRAGGGLTVYFRDVTERKRVQDRIAELNRDLARRIKEFETLLEVIPIGIAVAEDPECRVVRVNPAFARILGIEPGRNASLSVPERDRPPFRLLVDGREVASFELPMPRAARDGVEIRDVQIDILFPDGSRKAILGSAAPLFDEEQRPRGAISAYMDFTEQRKILEALHETKQRLQFHLENTPLGCVEWDPEFRVVGWNQEAERIFGWTAAEIIGQRIDHIRWVHEEDVPKVRAVMAEMLQGRSQTVNANRNYRKDGAVVDCEWYNSVLLNQSGELRSVMSVVVDVTARNQTERALRESEGKLRALLESASQGVLAVRRDGVMVLVNAQTERMFGYSRAELVGARLDVLIPERLRARHMAEVEAYFASPRTRESSAGLELTGRRKDGSEFLVEISLSPVEQGGEHLALALITDVTERRRIEEQLRQTQKLESLGVLAGGVAHDFNNLLTGIMGNASLLLDALPPSHPQRRAVEAIIRASDSAAHLTRQMLAYAGKGQFVTGPVDLSALVRDMAALLERSIPRSVQIHLDLQHGLPSVDADVGQMQQLVMNLIINAAEAIGDGAPGQVHVRTSLKRVAPAERLQSADGRPVSSGLYVCLEVRDTGCGIDQATRARIFEPFFTTKFVGRGLGLAAVHGIVRSHKGSILLETAPGRGSTFSVLLPGNGASDKGAPGGSGRSILIVADEPVVRDTAGDMLQRHDRDVIPAGDGREAVECVRNRPEIAAVRLDWAIPVKDSRAALQAIRRLRPDLPVVVTTGSSQADAVRDFGPGLQHFLQKPFTADALLQRMAWALSGAP